MGTRKEETGDETLIDEGETSLGSLVGEQSEEQEVVAEVEQPEVEKEAEAAEKQPDGGDGDLNDEQVAALPPTERAHYKGMKTERAKRQDLEKQLLASGENTQRLTDQVTQLMQMVKQGPGKVEEATVEEVASFWDDPEAFINGKMAGVSGNNTDNQQAFQTQRLEVSEMIAKSKHPDYEEKYKFFEDAAKANPAIVNQIVNSANPAQAAYDYGAQLAEASQIKEAGGVEGMRERIRAELLAEQNGGGELEKEIVAVLPKAHGSARSAGGGRQVETLDADSPLSDLVG